MKLGKRLATLSVSVSALVFGFVGVASAHVVVKPGEVLTGGVLDVYGRRAGGKRHGDQPRSS